MLSWSSHDHMVDTCTAVGLRGEYRIERVGRHGRRQWMLNARGHDGLTLLEILEGRAFTTLQDAQDYADLLDRARAVEAQVSGA